MTETTWWRRLFRRGAPPALDPDRDDLVVVASSFDDVEACSVVLARAGTTGWDADAAAVLRHHLRLPVGAVDGAVALSAQDGYVAAAPANAPDDRADGLVAVTLQRSQMLDAVRCSQERARMASLAQRAGGTAVGWDALQPPRDPR